MKPERSVQLFAVYERHKLIKTSYQNMLYKCLLLLYYKYFTLQLHHPNITYTKQNQQSTVACCTLLLHPTTRLTFFFKLWKWHLRLCKSCVKTVVMETGTDSLIVLWRKDRGVNGKLSKTTLRSRRIKLCKHCQLRILVPISLFSRAHFSILDKNCPETKNFI